MNTIKLLISTELGDETRTLLQELISTMGVMGFVFNEGLPVRTTIRATVTDGHLALFYAKSGEAITRVRLDSEFTEELPGYWTVYSMTDLRTGDVWLLVDEADELDRSGFYRELWWVRAFHRMGVTLSEFEYFLPAGGLYDPTINPLVSRFVEYVNNQHYAFHSVQLKGWLRVAMQLHLEDKGQDDDDKESIKFGESGLYCDSMQGFAMNSLFGLALQLEAFDRKRLGIPENQGPWHSEAWTINTAPAEQEA